MDSRTALKAGTTLRFNGGYEYTIINELARGGSTIVYNAFYVDNLKEKKTVRIKECYPFKCNLHRTQSGMLVIQDEEQKVFSEVKEKICRAYRLGNEFFATDGLTNLTANTYNIFEANNTLYVVCAYAQGQELSYDCCQSVKDSVAVVKSVASAICRIHRKGFLYLDIKPSNILILEGTTELIQLFDFDTVVPISSGLKLDSKISYTKGFAALELQRGDVKRIGRHTDVYGIGALLFYMLFDRRPDAFDCEIDAQYDFSKSKLSADSYQDRLFFRLTDFFHHTLADYYLDRFSDMETVIEKLSEIQRLADLSRRYLVNSKIYTSELFLGRKKETAWITERITDKSAGCSFVVGMGGIGKSTLVRQCIRQCRAELDVVLYLNFHRTIENTITDDYAVQIHGVQKDSSETEQMYFERKLYVLRELGKGQNCVLVIDNYTGDKGGAFSKLLQLGWHIFFLTRDRVLTQGYDTLAVGPISESEALLSMMAKNIGHELNEEERRCAVSIIQKADGHTLTVELIAKQIGSPVCSLTLSQAARIVTEDGFSGISSEKIGYRKDDILYLNTIQQIISGLFAAEALTEFQCVILKTLTLFGRTGISLDRLCEMLELKDRDDISLLYQQGWIYVNDTVITMHPVIEEAVSGWKLTEAVQSAVTKVFQYLDIRLQVEARKEEYPKNLFRSLDRVYDIPQNTFSSLMYRKLQNIFDKGRSDQTSKTYLYRLGSYANGTVTDHEIIREYLRLARAVLESGKRETKIYSSAIYKELLYYTIQNMPYENERFIQEKSEEFITLSDRGNELMLLKIYETLLAIRCLNVSNGDNSGIFLGECYRMKALLLIRSGIGKRKQVCAILEKVRRLIDKYAQPNSRLVRDYDMTMAWYYTYLEENYEQACAYMFKACDITDIISTSELAKIDDQFSPMANIMVEWQQYDEAELYLIRSILTCTKHLEIAAYARRQVELLGHLLEVYLYAEEYEKCQVVIEKIDEKVGKIETLDIENYVSMTIRETVAKKSRESGR